MVQKKDNDYRVLLLAVTLDSKDWNRVYVWHQLPW